MTLPKPLSVEVWFDLVCPWCLIGKRQFERALASYRRLHPQAEVEVSWRSQVLLPDIPPGGLPFVAFYEHRLGSAAAVAARQAQVREAARPVGLEFDFTRIPVMPNTRAAHGLIADAQAQCDASTVDALIEALFEAHFVRGLNLDDGELLDCLARSYGIATSEQAPVLQPGVQGVPTFVVNQKLVLSGAQSSERILSLLTEASALQ